MALQPPLQVEGQPPVLHIYLPVEQVYAIAWVLQQIESALSALPGPKCWEIYVYLDGGAATAARLIYHRLFEPGTVSPVGQLVLPPAASRPQPSAVLAPAANKSPSTSPAAPFQQHLVQRQKAYRPKQLVGGAIAVGVCSFLVGSGMAIREQSWRFLSGFSQPGQPEAIAVASEAHAPDFAASQIPPAKQLEPVLSEAETQAANQALTELTDRSSEAGWQPIAQPQGLSEAAHRLTVPPAIQSAVQIKAVGDVIPGTNFPDYRIPDPNYLFNSVKMFMGEVDLLFGNFESTLTQHPYSAKDTSRGMTFAFRTPPEFATVLREAGFDVLSVANNHSFDFGDPGFDDTIAHIKQAGMQAVGRKSEIVTVEANGYAIAFIGFSYWDDHNNMNDLATATQLVQQADEQADMVVISVHAGAEGTDALRVKNRTEYFFSENRGNMVQFSHAMIDAGADLILGHGPHVPRALELHQNKLIAYSLGNFLGYRTLSTVGPLGKSLILQVELNPEGDFLRGRIIPVALDPNGVPYIDDFFESVTLIRQLTAQDFPHTPLAIDQMGYVLRTD